MEKVTKYLRTLFITSMVLTVMLIAGIPMIVVGAVTHVYAVMGLGIAFTAAGFYGCPIAWTVYGSNISLKRVVGAVMQENLYTVQEISAQLNIDVRQVRAHLDKAFNRGYLMGYRRSGDVISVNESIAESKRELVAECPNCGAKFTYTADNARCPYCNSPVIKQ